MNYRKKITLFLNTLPYPPIHGAKVDVWRKIVIMHQLGYHLQIICWSHEFPTPEQKKEIEKKCDQLIIFSTKMTFQGKYKITFLSFFYSLYPAKILVYTDYCQLEKHIKPFSPNILWLESHTPGLPALKISKKLSIPLFYRSHNIEHIYTEAITSSIAQMTLKERFLRFLISFRLKKFEQNLFSKSHTIYDISLDDMRFWKRNYPHKNIVWLPPLTDSSAPTDTLPTSNKTIDFLFIGNLHAQNNILALRWLIEDIMPLVQIQLPNTCLHIVGSQSTKKFLAYLQSFSYIKTSINVNHIEPFLNNSRIVVNPALKGSGITIKTIDGLHSNNIWVGTEQAFKGLPSEFYKILHPAKSTKELAEQMIYFYNNPNDYPYTKVSLLCKKYFDTLPKKILSNLFEQAMGK